MDKESPEIIPKNLDGSDTVVNTVSKISSEEIKKAAEEEKEKKENYYVDPLEQESLMKEKREKIEAEKAEKRKEENNDDEYGASIDETIRPDMNITGYFSTGATATKPGFMKRPASSGILSICFIFGTLNAIYSAFYTVSLITTSFDTHWFMGWIYAVTVVFSLFIIINSIRSLNIQKDTLKRKALVGLVGSGISVIPLIAWFIHWIMQLV